MTPTLHQSSSRTTPLRLRPWLRRPPPRDPRAPSPPGVSGHSPIMLVTTVGTALLGSSLAYPLDGQEVRDSSVVLADGRAFVPGLQHIRFHALLGPPGPHPYLVLSGIGCTDCDSARSVYVLRFGQRWNSPDPRPVPVFAYPGTVNGPENQGVARSRLFVGACLAELGYAVVQFAQLRTSTGGWVRGTKVAVLDGDSVVTLISDFTTERVKEVTGQVERGTCTDIAPDSSDTQS